MAIDTGLPLVGGTLPLLPPSASREDQTTAINAILSKLNSWNGVIVTQGIANIVVTSSAINWAIIPHNLGYVPVVEAFLNDIGISPITTAGAHGTLPFPTFAAVDVSGGDVTFQIWFFGYADETNAYLVCFNATGVAQGTYSATYLLKRFQANQV